MKMTWDEIRWLFQKEVSEDGRYEKVEETPWEDGGKYQYCDLIFKDTETGKFYRTQISKSGSYYSDYYWCWEDGGEADVFEVTKVEKVITVWEAIANLVNTGKVTGF